MVTPRYSSDDIQHFQATAGRLKLSVPTAFWLTPIEQIRGMCNGVGGKGSGFTWAFTFIYRHYQISTAIHDVDYTVAERPKKEADRALRGNMLKEWKARYGIWRFFTALKERTKIEAAYFAVSAKGHQYYGNQS